MMVLEIIQLVVHQHNSHFIAHVVKKSGIVIYLKVILIQCVKGLCILRHILVTMNWTKLQQIKTVRCKYKNRKEEVRTATIARVNF